MRAGILLVPTLVALMAIPSLAQDKKPEAGFKMHCTSDTTKTLPKGNAGAGKVDFVAEVDPAGQSVTIEGKKRPAKIDPTEIAFGGSEDAVFSISRSRKTFGMVGPIKGLPNDDSRKYLYFTGTCKAA